MRYGQRDRDECLRRAGNTRDQIIRAEYLCLVQEWADMADEVNVFMAMAAAAIAR